MQPDGTICKKEEEEASTNENKDESPDAEKVEKVECKENLITFFSEGSEGKYVPRAIFVDLEPTVIGKSVSTYLSQ